MEIFHIISVAVPLAIFFGLPRVLPVNTTSERNYRSILLVACLLFFISWYLPSPLIEGKDTSFVTHFVGGGVFCALLWFYIARSLPLRLTWYMELTMVFALVSSLGAINELFEFILVYTGIASILLSDTSWDIVANTLGALTAFSGILIIERLLRKQPRT